MECGSSPRSSEMFIARWPENLRRGSEGRTETGLVFGTLSSAPPNRAGVFAKPLLGVRRLVGAFRLSEKGAIPCELSVPILKSAAKAAHSNETSLTIYV